MSHSAREREPTSPDQLIRLFRLRPRAGSKKKLRQKERLLFRRLSVFAGDCTLEAMEAICAWHATETELVGTTIETIDGCTGTTIKHSCCRSVNRFLYLSLEREIFLEKALDPVYSQPFFELQLFLAQKIAALSGQPLAYAILHSTAFYRIFGLDWSLDPTNSTWRDYVQGIEGYAQMVEIADFTYQFYLQHFDAIPKFTDEEHWGCFTYNYNPAMRVVQLHFSDQDSSEYGPLSAQRVDVRKAELRAMFQHIQERYPHADLVRGGSWLYNWESYKRLFPPAFGQSTIAQKRPGLTGRAVWGQFLRRGWRIHEETMKLFLQRVSQLERVEEYPGCFPYAVLLTQAPISLFYKFYGLIHE